MLETARFCRYSCTMRPKKPKQGSVVSGDDTTGALILSPSDDASKTEVAKEVLSMDDVFDEGVDLAPEINAGKVS